MDDDMLALYQSDTWELISFPLGSQWVGCRSVHTAKGYLDGSPDKVKVGLVAKGCDTLDRVCRIYEVLPKFSWDNSNTVVEEPKNSGSTNVNILEEATSDCVLL